MDVRTKLLLGGGMAAAAGLGLRTQTPDNSLVRPVATGIAAVGGATALVGAAMLFRGPYRALYDVRLGAQELAPHQIRARDVEAYLEDSVVQRRFYHCGNRDRLVETGVVSPLHGGAYGRGFYTASRPEWIKHGTSVTPVAIHTTNPLYVSNRSHLMGIVERLEKEQGGRHIAERSERIYTAVHNAGYDSIIVARNGLHHWVVGLDPDKIKIVVR